MDTTSKMTRQGEGLPERVKQHPTAAPRVDVYENANELLLIADVPGATKESISIHLDKGQVTIEAVRPDDAPARALIAEYRPCDYLRTFSIPAGIDASKMDAQLAAGVLRLRLPKSEAAKPRRIEVRSG
jgi:HSP20 family molecular chaperone IbpA